MGYSMIISCKLLEFLKRVTAIVNEIECSFKPLHEAKNVVKIEFHVCHKREIQFSEISVDDKQTKIWVNMLG